MRWSRPARRPLDFIASLLEGLRLVAAHLDVPVERLVACGDSAADESLLLAAAVGIAVGDAPATLRAAAQLVVSQDGLAETLRRAVESLG